MNNGLLASEFNRTREVLPLFSVTFWKIGGGGAVVNSFIVVKVPVVEFSKNVPVERSAKNTSLEDKSTDVDPLLLVVVTCSVETLTMVRLSVEFSAATAGVAGVAGVVEVAEVSTEVEEVEALVSVVVVVVEVSVVVDEGEEVVSVGETDC